MACGAACSRTGACVPLVLSMGVRRRWRESRERPGIERIGFLAAVGESNEGEGDDEGIGLGLGKGVGCG